MTSSKKLLFNDQKKTVSSSNVQVKSFESSHEKRDLSILQLVILKMHLHIKQVGQHLLLISEGSCETVRMAQARLPHDLAKATWQGCMTCQRPHGKYRQNIHVPVKLKCISRIM